MLVPGIREPLVVAFLPHVLDGHKVAGVPLSVQGRKDLGSLLRVLGLDVDAAFVALRVDGDVQDESVVTGRATLKDLLLDLPHPGGLGASAHWIPVSNKTFTFYESICFFPLLLINTVG